LNRWGIPAGLEREVISRDAKCVYCGVDFSAPAQNRGSGPSWEHIVNDASLVTAQNIARCCIACNASKGTKNLRAWLLSPYCQRKGITEQAVSEVVRQYLAR
jgi:5-methylcytosine-specific restriction endonuclease McrA